MFARARESKKIDIEFLEKFSNCIKENPENFEEIFEYILPENFVYCPEKKMYKASFLEWIDKSKLDKIIKDDNIEIHIYKEDNEKVYATTTEYLTTYKGFEILTESFRQNAEILIKNMELYFLTENISEKKIPPYFLQAIIDFSNYLRSWHLDFDEIYHVIEEIGSLIYKKFNRYYHDSPIFIEFNDYILRLKGSENITKLAIHEYKGYKAYNLHHFLTDNKIIDPGTPFNYIKQFLKGEIPDKKINWLKEARHLRYFIDEYSKSNKLKEKCCQPYIMCPSIFKLKDKNLELNWARNHNKLRNPDAIRLLDEALSKIF